MCTYIRTMLTPKIGEQLVLYIILLHYYIILIHLHGWKSSYRSSVSKVDNTLDNYIQWIIMILHLF